jgi:hypothetical protein
MRKSALLLTATLLLATGIASAQANFAQGAPSPKVDSVVTVKSPLSLEVPRTSLEVYALIDEYLGDTNATGKGAGSQLKLDSGGYQATRAGVRGYVGVNDSVRVTYALGVCRS